MVVPVTTAVCGRSSRDNHHSNNLHYGHFNRNQTGPHLNRPTRPTSYFSPSSIHQWHQPPWPYWASPYWAHPSCPFPTNNWANQKINNSSPHGNSSARLLGSRPTQSFGTDTHFSTGYYPTDVDLAMHTLSLSSPNEQYYMNTGATSHMTRS